MESFLKDTSLESHVNESGFRSFIEPKETSTDDSVSTTEEGKPDLIPDSSADEAEAIDPATESAGEGIDEIAGEEVSSEDADSGIPASVNPDSNSSTNPDDTTAPAPVDEDAVSEIVFEQVDGPKVEVISEDGDVTKIIVHLAPDKILELKCEY
jgi:hypothetical protein